MHRVRAVGEFSSEIEKIFSPVVTGSEEKEVGKAPEAEEVEGAERMDSVGGDDCDDQEEDSEIEQLEEKEFHFCFSSG
jgi:hypothetical protein